jgi:hypothetical protein
MDGQILVPVLAGALFAFGIGLVWRPIMSAWREARFAEARRDFHLQRERLEAKFVQLGMSGSRPDVPRWTDCDFDDDVAYARSRSTKELSAFVGVTIEMEGLDEGGLGTFRSATAVFRFDRDHWETDGRAIFNLSPIEAIRYYQGDLEIVRQEVQKQ